MSYSTVNLPSPVSVKLQNWTWYIIKKEILADLKFHQKHSATRLIVKSSLGVWKCSQTWSFVFDILHL